MAEIYKIGSDDIQDKTSEFGGTNLIVTTANVPYSSQTWSSWFTPVANTTNSCGLGFHDILFPEGTKVGDKFVFSYEIEWTKFTAGTGGTFYSPNLQWYANGSWSSGIASPFTSQRPASVSEVTTAAGSKKFAFVVTVSAENQITANWWANFRTDYSDGTGKFRVRNFKLEKSNGTNKATDWTPAPQDLVTYSNESLVFFQ